MANPMTKAQLQAELASVEATRKDVADVTFKTAVARAAQIGNVPTEAGIQRSMLMLYWTLGVQARKAGKDIDLALVYDGYFASYYRQDVDRPRKLPTDDSKATARQNFAKFYNFGKDVAWNSYPAVARVLAERNMPINLRGAMVNKIKDAHKDKAPTDKELAAFFEPKPEGEKEPYTPDADLKAFCSSIMRRADVEEYGEMIKALRAKDQAAALAIFGEIQHLALELRAMLSSTPKETAKRKPLAETIAKLPRKHGNNVVPMRRKAA